MRAYEFLNEGPTLTIKRVKSIQGTLVAHILKLIVYEDKVQSSNKWRGEIRTRINEIKAVAHKQGNLSEEVYRDLLVTGALSSLENCDKQMRKNKTDLQKNEPPSIQKLVDSIPIPDPGWAHKEALDIMYDICFDLSKSTNSFTTNTLRFMR